MNPLNSSFRTQFLLGFAACTGLLAYALYLQYHDGLFPCPLCTFQRGAYFLLALAFLAGGLHAPKGKAGRGAYGALALLAAGLGIAIAGRHVWLQHLPPDQVPACGPDLNFMLRAFPLGDVVRRVLTGSGECATVDWRLLGLSMAEWSLLCFAALFAWAAWAAFRSRGR
jgi:disulfide bond formation protein DsbB